MTRTQKFLLAAVGLIVVIIVALICAAPSIQRSFFYPKPHGMPAVVSQTTEQLLARLQTMLESNAPIVAASLQPGLTDAQITMLESQGGG